MDLNSNTAPHILLIAGGVGINPLYSMLLAVQDCLAVYQSIKLMYSAKSVEELQFKVSLPAVQTHHH